MNDAGLVAIIYFNHGVTLSEQGRYPAALAIYFRGLRLDPESAALVRNSLAALTGWSKAEVGAGRFDVARGVLLAGLMLTPDDSTLRGNVPFVCQEQLKVVAARDGDEAARVVAADVMTACPEPLQSDVAEVIENHAVRRVGDLQKQGRRADAEAYVRRHVATIAPLGERCVSDLRECLHAPGVDDATDDSDPATTPLQP